jgi:hypothetical protein
MMVDVGDKSLGSSLERAKAELAARKRSTANEAKSAKTPKAKKPRSRKASADPMVNQLVSPFTQQHGDYQPQDFTLRETVRDGKTRQETIRVVRNLGGTPIERWHRAGAFDERQMAAILFYQEAHRKVFGEGPRMTASYSPVIIRTTGDAVSLWAGSVMAARESLQLIDNEVNFKLPLGVWPVWENVVIFDEAAGVAGGRAGYRNKAAEGAAKAIVTIVANLIADIVIDSSKSDFGDLIRDLDAPRRPGGGKRGRAA